MVNKEVGLGMKIFNLQGFNSKANLAINEAFAVAREHKYQSVYTSHMLYELLKFKEVAERFYSDTGMQANDFRSKFDAVMDAESNLNDSESYTDLDMEDMSSEFHEILVRILRRKAPSGIKIEPIDIYNEIITDKNTEAWVVLEEMGVDRERDINFFDDALNSMPMTSRFACNYNVLAKSGRFDPIEARDKEINDIIEVLGRRIKNNPCLIGDAGVGKTAIIEGLAQRLVEGDVPEYLKDKQIISVDLSGIVSGSKYRGEFEERFNNILYEAAENKNVILFFDEMHMLMDAGSSSESSMSAANIIKPAISRGDVQIIGATTTKEYKKFIEKDKALERRLQYVMVSEPSVDDAISMIKKVISKYNEFHNSEISEDAIEAAVVLSDRYITDKKLPDKAITTIDETAARLKKNVDGKKKIYVDVTDIKQTVSKLTGIDVADMDETARNKMKSLEDRLSKHVIGQNDAIVNVSRAIRRSKAGVNDPNKPIGSFLFVGPTGVGKTELTKALAIEFSGGIKNMIRFDMSEFMEKHSVSKLIGSPPGYVGYGDGGQLTEAVRRNPYSIILFDEIEKAHPDVFNIMLQILDDGILTDSEGTKVDFKNTVIIMTSNAGYGAALLNKKTIGFGSIETEKKDDSKEKVALKALEDTFRPEFLNRIDKVIVFNSLTKDNCHDIVDLMLNKLKQRVSNNGIKLTWDESVIDELITEGYSDKYGARNLRRKIQELIEDELADKIIDDEVHSGDSIKLSYKDKLNIKVRHKVNREIKLEDSPELRDEGCVIV